MVNNKNAASADTSSASQLADLSHFVNGDEIINLMKSPTFKSAKGDKTVGMKLQAYMVSLHKSSVVERKTILYMLNRYIMFTKLISSLQLSWTQNKDMWARMGGDKERVDENGKALYDVLGGIESYHKKVTPKSMKLSDGLPAEVQREMANQVRRSITEYAVELLTQLYRGQEVPPPLHTPENDLWFPYITEVYDHLDEFKSATDKFKQFVKDTPAEPADYEQNKTTKRKARASKTLKPSKKIRVGADGNIVTEDLSVDEPLITRDMVNDDVAED